MDTCCVSCKKNTTNKNSSVRKTKQSRLMLLSNCTVLTRKNQGLLKSKKQVD